MAENIQQSAIDAIARHINERNNKEYRIPVIGTTENAETPHIFEIMAFDEIDKVRARAYAVDGSKNSHCFYNGVAIGLYRGGYVCFDGGQQLRMNNHEDPVVLGEVCTPENILITCDEHLFAIYDELVVLEPVAKFLEFLNAGPEEVFPYKRDLVCSSISTLLGFCQEVLEWALVYEIGCRPEVRRGDYILKDGTLRSLNIKQEYIVRLGRFLAKDKGLVLVGITKDSPTKMELAYTFRQIDNYLQDKLKPKYPFKQSEPGRQKLCCWFEIPDAVLLNAYGARSSGMYVRKALKGGRGVGLFFAGRLVLQRHKGSRI